MLFRSNTVAGNKAKTPVNSPAMSWGTSFADNGRQPQAQPAFASCQELFFGTNLAFSGRLNTIWWACGQFDLCTVAGHRHRPLSSTERREITFFISLFLNDFFLFKCCTIVTSALTGGRWRGFPESFPHSYPQFLWVRFLLIKNNRITRFCDVISRSQKQAPDGK